MAHRQTDLLNKEFHPQAETLFLKRVDDFAVSLLLQAKVIAFRKQAELVLSSHVKEALETITTRQTQTWKRQLFAALGGAFFGAFIQGFAQELYAGNATLVVVYVVMGFAGIVMILTGLMRPGS